jgi:hypothetical protein
MNSSIGIAHVCIDLDDRSYERGISSGMSQLRKRKRAKAKRGPAKAPCDHAVHAINA